MKRWYVLPVIALIGIAVAIAAVIHTNRPVRVEPRPVQASQSPFPSNVAGAGIVEVGRGNIAIGTSVSGVVQELYVKVGDQVAAEDRLFKVDDRDVQAKWATARAQVKEAQASLEKPTHRLETATHLAQLSPGAISAQELSNLRDDVGAAQSALASAIALAEQFAVEIERCRVRAPSAGRILQINTRVGEFADAGNPARPLVLMGKDARVYLRVDIDESEARRIRPEAQAVAFVRGTPGIKIPLRFEYIEPYVVPKTSLTGQGTERSDVRVLQVIYSFEPDAQAVYMGQQMDVFVQALAEH